MTIIYHIIGNSPADKPSDDGHEKLEQAEVKRKAKDMAE